MGFPESVRTCLSNYVTFSGRARRSEYWWFVLFTVLGGIVFGLIDAILFGTGPQGRGGPLASLYQLAVFLPLLAAGWRRMHDTGRSGWVLLLPVAVSLAIWIFLMGGLFGFALVDQSGTPDSQVRDAAGLAGGILVSIGAIVQLVIAVLLVWWLTRPTQPGPNDYGPAP